MAPAPRARPVRTLWRVVLAIVLLVIGLAVAGELSGWPFLRAPAQSLLERKLARPVRIDAPFRLHLLGAVRLSAGRLWIAAPAGFDAPHLVDAGDVAVRLDYRNLLAARRGEPLRIDTVDVGRIDARLLRHGDGASTWQLGPPRAGESAPPPTVDHLAVKNGTIELVDAVTKTRLEITFATQEGAAQRAATSRAALRGELRGHPIEGELEAAGLLRLAARGEDAAVPAKARVDYGGLHAEFDGTVTDLLGARDLAGKVSARGPSLGVLGDLVHVVLPTTAAFSLRGTLKKEGELWRAEVDSATVGQSAVNGRFTYDARPATPRLDGTLGGERFILADLAPAFGTRNPDGSPVKPPPGRVLPDRKLDLPQLKNMDARVAVDVAHVDLGAAFAEPISPLRATLELDGGRMTLSGIDARTAKGRLGGQIAVDSRRDPPRWSADLDWAGIRLEDWIGKAKARERADAAKTKAAGGAANAAAKSGAAPPPYFTGRLHGRAKLSGSGQSTAKLLGSLDGEITMAVRQGSVSHLVIEVLGLDVAQGLGLVFAGDAPLPVECAVADLSARHGRLTPRVALVDTPVTLVLADGSVDLGDETLALRLTAKPKNVSPFTLRSPIRVRGHFAAPAVAPEAGPLARKALAGLALGFVNPLAALIPFVDPGEAVRSPCSRSLAALRGRPR